MPPFEERRRVVASGDQARFTEFCIEVVASVNNMDYAVVSWKRILLHAKRYDAYFHKN